MNACRTTNQTFAILETTCLSARQHHAYLDPPLTHEITTMHLYGGSGFSRVGVEVGVLCAVPHQTARPGTAIGNKKACIQIAIRRANARKRGKACIQILIPISSCCCLQAVDDDLKRQGEGIWRNCGARSTFSAFCVRSIQRTV